MRDEDLAARAELLGVRMMEGFREALGGHPAVRDIRGRGLMIGIEVSREVNVLKERALQRGLILNVTRDHVIRLLPPLILDETQADEIVSTVCELLHNLD
jgi:acetylornithine aminotransferase